MFSYRQTGKGVQEISVRLLFYEVGYFLTKESDTITYYVCKRKEPYGRSK